jgi:phosphatidylglycerophosphatase A
MKKFSIFVSTLFGTGYFPFAPGTVGTLLAFLLYLFLPLNFEKINFTEAFVIIMLFGLSIPLISKAEEKLGHDDKKIVIDELFGYLVSVLFFEKKLIILILAFVFFRIFDIFKPEPVNSLQKLPRGLGVMMDDIFAGIYANVLIRIIILLFPIIGIKI